MSGITTRLFLGLTLLLAVAAAYFSLDAIRSGDAQAWATLAAALAVVTSVVSAWGAQRVIELEEAKQKPYPYPQFDATSRYGLLLLKVTNLGGGVAHNIRLEWNEPLKDHKGETIRFSPDSEGAEISLLMPGSSITKIVDGHVQFFQIERVHIYRGTVHYHDGAGRKKAHPFLLDAEVFKGTPLYDDEGLKTHYELQKLPERIRDLGRELQKIAKNLEGP